MKIIGLIGGFALLAFCIRGCSATEEGKTNSAFGYGFGIVVGSIIVLGLLSEGKIKNDEEDEEFEND